MKVLDRFLAALLAIVGTVFMWVFAIVVLLPLAYMFGGVDMANNEMKGHCKHTKELFILIFK